MRIKYPTRCKIIDVGNKSWRKTPNVSKPHIGKFGLAENINGLVKITLDDSHVVWGHECWWIPIEEQADHEAPA